MAFARHPDLPSFRVLGSWHERCNSLRRPSPTRRTVQTVKNEKSDALIPKNRAIKILARSIYRELTTQGYDEKQVVSLATELISAVTEKMSGDRRA
jgi:hypothetical protein